MHLFWVESRSRARVGKWIGTGSCAAFIMLTLMSPVWGRGPFGLFGRNNDPDKDKENRPWTYASGALARSNPPLSTSDSPAALNETPASGDKAGSSQKQPDASPKQPDGAAQPAPFGDPQAPAKMAMLEQEIRTGLRSRGIEGDFARFNSYLASTLRATSSAYTGSEVTGNCRLSWYDHLLRNPLKAPAEAEQFTRELHRAVLSGPKGLAQVLATIRRKLDLPDHPPG